MTLIFDTTGLANVIGIVKNGKLTCRAVTRQKPSGFLIKTIAELIGSPKKLKEIIVVVGPGSFTGIRLGVTITNTFAHELKIKLKTVTNFDLGGEYIRINRQEFKRQAGELTDLDNLSPRQKLKKIIDSHNLKGVKMATPLYAKEPNITP